MGDQPEQFEAAFERLQTIVEKLEGGDVTLEESLALYAEGMGLVRFCGEKLSAAQEKIEQLSATASDSDARPSGSGRKEGS